MIPLKSPLMGHKAEFDQTRHHHLDIINLFSQHKELRIRLQERFPIKYQPN